MNIELGLYKTTEELRLRMGVTVFTLPEGSEVSITQLDKTGGRVMLHSGRHCDWVYKTIMKYLEKVDEV